MCGIGGIFCDNSSVVDPDDLSRLSDALLHRGPDGQGSWISPNRHVGLVHTRLAILDTAPTANQPMCSADRRFWIVFNGEIYNFLEIRSELSSLGHQFRTQSDTEVILEGWSRWGTDLLARMNGMWAFAIYDIQTGDTILARDRFGVKPLYYSQAKSRFVFASEARALRELPWLNIEIDDGAVQRMLVEPLSLEAGERTLFRSILRLPAGHLAVVTKNHVKTKRWWRTFENLHSPPATNAQQVERFRELFYDSVRLRLRSDVAIGTCLSGGFDSTAIVSAMSQIAGASSPHVREATDWRHAFIAAFPGKANDETAAALQAVSYASVKPHLIRIGDEATRDIDAILSDLDDVYTSLPTAVWETYRMLRKRGVVVSIDGHGADELMGAYRQKGRNIHFITRNIADSVQSHYARKLVDAAKVAWLNAHNLRFVRPHTLSTSEEFSSPFEADPLPVHWGLLNRRLYRMFHITILPAILRNFDRMSMAHGIEVRMPFMDWRLVTHVMSLPASAKWDGRVTKAIARNAMRDRMPESIRVNSKKVGFNSPMPEWLNGQLFSWTVDLFAKPNALFDNVVDTKRLFQRIAVLTKQRAWDWRSADALWPYIHMRWYLGQTSLPAYRTRPLPQRAQVGSSTAAS